MATAYVKKSAGGNKRLEKEGVVKRNSLTNVLELIMFTGNRLNIKTAS